MTAHGPLHGIRIIEMDAIGPVPLCGMILSDLGAEVVRIARPGGQAAFRPETVRGGGAVWRGGSRRGRLAQEIEQGVHGQSLWQHRPETVHRTASRPQIEPHRLRAGQWV